MFIPQSPEELQGRVVAFGFSVTGNRGKSSTPAKIYKQDFKKEISAFKQYAKRVEEAKKNKKKVKIREVPPVPAFASLNAQDRQHYKDRADQEIPISFYKVHDVTRNEPDVDAAQSSSSVSYSSKQAALLTQNSPAFIKPNTVPAILTLFETHHGTYENALAYQAKKKNKHGKWAVLSVSWINLIRNSWILSEEDVRVSGCMKALPSVCCTCGGDQADVQLTYCDGSVFPGRGPTAFPCNRLMICTDCRAKEDVQYRGTDSWFCPDCVNTEHSFRGLYGYQITPPRDDEFCRPVSRLISTGTGKKRERVFFNVRPLGAPIIDERTNHNPALELKAFLDQKESKPLPAYEDQVKQRAATEFLDIFTEAALSAGQQSIIMKGLNRMQDKGYLKTDVKIFSKPETLLKRAERGGYGDSFGSTPNTYMLDSSALLQGETHVAVVLLNPLHVIQRILLKESIPEKAIYLGNGQFLRFDNKTNGERGVGGKVYMNRVFCERCLDFPNTDVKLALALATDKVVASGRTSFPLYWQLLNVDDSFALEATELAGFLPVCARRKPHGGQVERFSREQHESHLQLANDAVGLAFKFLEEGNRQGGVMMRFKDGRIRRVHFMVLSISEDIEGKVDDALVSSNWCFRCFGENSHFGSWMIEHICSQGPLGPRTPLKTFACVLSLCLNQIIPKQMGATDERATSLGMKHFKVCNQLLAFEKCFGERGVYAALNYDDLHMLFLGLFVLILSAADVLFCTYFKRTKFMQSHEDVHQWVEYFLALSPGMNDGVHILKQMKMGWFRLEAWNGVDNESFLSHILFVFSTHDLLIRDLPIRIAFADIVRNVYSLYVRVKVKTYFRISELEQIEKDIQALFRDLQELFQLQVDTSSDDRSPETCFVFQGNVSTPLESKRRHHKKRDMGSDDDDEDEDARHDSEDEPAGTFNFVAETTEEVTATLGGNQTRTPKCHMLTYLPQHLLDYGSLNIGTTRPFENLHRLVKAWTSRSNRAKLGAVEAQVLMKSFTTRMDAAPKSLKSIRARLYHEQHSPGISSGLVSDEELEESEMVEGTRFLHSHSGTESVYYFLFYLKRKRNFIICMNRFIRSPFLSSQSCRNMLQKQSTETFRGDLPHFAHCGFTSEVLNFGLEAENIRGFQSRSSRGSAPARTRTCHGRYPATACHYSLSR